jgi:hypothetical protein
MVNALKTIALRLPCMKCNGSNGHIETRNGQDCVFCDCGRYQYNAPKSETGREVRSVRTRQDISPSQRYRVMERANRTCELCNKKDCNLHVDHALSVDAAKSQGLNESIYNSDENLIVLCEECNSGKSDMALPVRILIGILMTRNNLK